MKNFFYILLVAVFLACNSNFSRKDHSIHWQNFSPEYDALCIQAYNIAKNRIDKLNINDSNKPLAIIADIDETMLNNLPYNQMLIDSSLKFSQKTWSQWVNKKIAKPIPGALNFFNHVDSIGIEIIYISNRKIENYEPTKLNLINAGFPFNDNTIMLLRDIDSNKEKRRNTIGNFNVVMLLGDNLADFKDSFYGKSNVDKKKIVELEKKKFGNEFILFPNLIYGPWEEGFEK